MIRIRPRAAKRRFGDGRPRPTALAVEWQQWLAENLLRGLGEDELLPVLDRQGVPRALARGAVETILRSPTYRAARGLTRRLRQAELLCRLRVEVERSIPGSTEVPRLPAIDPSVFMTTHFAFGVPLVLTEVVTGWKAFGKWTPAYLKEHFGDVEVEVSSGRAADPAPDINFVAHVEKTTLGAYVDRVLVAGDTNDLYMIAQNRNLQRTGLSALLGDVELPPYLDAATARGGSALWLGPAGTVTPLHHDTSSILFCQLHGRKRIQLVSPFELSILDGARGVYAGVDAEEPDLERFPGFPGVTVKTVTLLPGEALFIPAGYWHHVRALDVSISLALNCFRVRNAYEWYKPGGAA